MNRIRRHVGLALAASAVAVAAHAAPGATTATTLAGATARTTAARELITSAIDESVRVTQKGNTRREAVAKNDLGRVSDTMPLQHLTLILKRPAERERALTKMIDEMHDPKSANFHQWLTPQQIGQDYGLSANDLAKVQGWVRAHGMTVNALHSNGVFLDISGTAAQVRSAFHTEIHKLSVNGKTYIANMSDPSIPAALAGAVHGVAKLNSFMPHPMLAKVVEPIYTFKSGSSTYRAVVPADLATIYNFNPLYTAGIAGQGQTIMVVEDTDLFSGTNDWATFRKTFGLALKYRTASLTQVNPSGTVPCADPGVNSDDIEAALDVEWASAAAPGAAIINAACDDTDTQFGGFIAMQNMFDSGTAPSIISISYGDPESDLGSEENLYIYDLYQTGVAQGVSIFVSSGDESAASSDPNAKYATHGINVSGFTSTPYNVSVGGTDFGDTYAGSAATYWNSTNTSTYGSAKSYIPEVIWNDSCAGQLTANYYYAHGLTTNSLTYGSTGLCNNTSYASLTTASGSGGPSGCALGDATVTDVVSGTCAGYPKPSWQAGIVGNPSDGVRDIPDVSLMASNGWWGHYYIFCYSDTANGGTSCLTTPSGWSGAGGTSISSPIMAGIQALVNQKTGQKWGNPNPTLYAMAKTAYGSAGNSSCNSSLGNTIGSSCVFNDITLGDFDVPCTGTLNCYLPSGTYGVLSTSSSSFLPAYGTAVGWDFASGIGSVNATNLVNNWPTTVAN